MTERSDKSHIVTRRYTTDGGDRVVVLLDGAPVASVDLMAGASPAALESLARLGLSLEDVLADEWARD